MLRFGYSDDDDRVLIYFSRVQANSRKLMQHDSGVSIFPGGIIVKSTRSPRLASEAQLRHNYPHYPMALRVPNQVQAMRQSCAKSHLRPYGQCSMSMPTKCVIEHMQKNVKAQEQCDLQTGLSGSGGILALVWLQQNLMDDSVVSDNV